MHISCEPGIMSFLCLFSPQYIVECHGTTLLPQFLGMYRLTVDGDETYMIVTRNVFSHRLSVYKKYDLKVRIMINDWPSQTRWQIWYGLMFQFFFSVGVYCCQRGKWQRKGQFHPLTQKSDLNVSNVDFSDLFLLVFCVYCMSGLFACGSFCSG